MRLDSLFLKQNLRDCFFDVVFRAVYSRILSFSSSIFIPRLPDDEIYRRELFDFLYFNNWGLESPKDRDDSVTHRELSFILLRHVVGRSCEK